jgi:spore maturation protein CgeB
MKILFLGSIGVGQTSRMRMRALQRLGHTVRGVDTIEPWYGGSWAGRQIQRRLGRGPVVDRINRSILEAASDFGPDMVWAEKQEYVRRGTLESLRVSGARLVHFTPDPYFSVPWKRTPVMDEAIGAFDALVYCKAYERAAFEAVGVPLVYMPLGYCDEVHRPLPSEDPKWSCAVGFLGGWDPRRETMLRGVAASGADLKLWGEYWDFLRDGRWTPRRFLILRQLAGGMEFRIRKDAILAACLSGGEVYADDYARALTGARIGVGFLRTVWPDQHTTRTFEIPACGSMLLADRTEEHQSFFAEGKEADYFSSPEELVDKVRFYSANEEARARIAEAGLARCRSGRYAYIHRLEDALKTLDRIA